MARTDPTDGELINLDDIRDEAFTNLYVSVEAQNLTIDFSTTFVLDDYTKENAVLMDDTVTVFCSYDNPEKVNPPPSMKILIRDENEFNNYIKNDILLAKGGIDETNSTSNKYVGFNELKATKKINKDDMGKVFVCVCVQIFEDRVIYSNEISSEPLEVFQKPTLKDNYHLPDYYLVNETNSSDIINIPVKFASIPRPENKHIIWTIEEFNTNEDDESENNFIHEIGENETFIIHPGTLISRFSTHPLRRLKDDLYEAIIEIRNVTNNVSISLEVSNMFGQFNTVLPEIIVIPKPPPPVVKASGPMLWVIVLIVAILVISLLMFILMVCINRKNKRHKQELEMIRKNDNVQVEKSVYRKERVVMDQNDLKFHVSELGESHKLKRINKKQSDFRASLQDLRNSNVSPNQKRLSRQKPLSSKKVENEKDRNGFKVPSDKKQSAHDNTHIKSPNNSLKRQKVISSSSFKSLSPKLKQKDQVTQESTDIESESEIEEPIKTEPIIMEKETTKRVTFLKDELEEEEKSSLNYTDYHQTESKPVLRHSGPTNYPVMAPPDGDDSFKKTPSRVTSPIHFTGPTEVIVPIIPMSS